MSLATSLLAQSGWVAAARSPLREILQLGRPLARSYLQHIFTAGAQQWPVSQGLGVGHALVDGLLFGLGHGLPASATGQSFLWPYLFNASPLLPDVTPAAWTVCLLAAGLGLAVLLRSTWTALWQSLRHPVTDPDALGEPTAPPDWVALVAAIVPCLLLQWRLGPVGQRYEAAATVGIFLALTGRILLWGESRALRGLGRSPQVPPWLALIAGLLAGFGALPGLSALAILIAAGLYGRVSGEGAARFGLMVITVVLLLQGLVGLPGALGSLPAELLPLVVGALLGAMAGGWLLLASMRLLRRRALPVIASYCTAMAGFLLLFGVFTR